VSPLRDARRRAASVCQQAHGQSRRSPAQAPARCRLVPRRLLPAPLRNTSTRLAGLQAPAPARTWFPHSSKLALTCSQSKGTTAQIMTVISSTRCHVTYLIFQFRLSRSKILENAWIFAFKITSASDVSYIISNRFTLLMLNGHFCIAQPPMSPSIVLFVKSLWDFVRDRERITITLINVN